MYLSELRIENFRLFGEGNDGLTVSFEPGLTALVGENDSGKTAIIDAVRLALGTRDQEYIRLSEDDFHQPSSGAARRAEISIRCRFDDLSGSDISSFAEHLTHEEADGNGRVPVLFVTWRATRNVRRALHRRYTTVEVRSGEDASGPTFDAEIKAYLSSAYLRPLRDAERALSAGRGSRLSQILQHTKEVTDHGVSFDPLAAASLDPSNLSVLGIADYADHLLENHVGIGDARSRLNDNYLAPLSFADDTLQGSVSVGGTGRDADQRLRQLLEKLEIELTGTVPEGSAPSGLGSNNLLFMACELLLLGSDEDGLPLLLIEEPEAHLHPQRQLRLMQFLQNAAAAQSIQILVTTHSPNLASAIDVERLVLLDQRRAFPLHADATSLSRSDYRFLQRFLDVTKANLFFARGVIIVEGDAENILLPALARLLGMDLTSHGVSIVNVGGIGLRRFSRIFQRSDSAKDGEIRIPVACVTDLDVMPDCAVEIFSEVKEGEPWPEKSDRKWRAIADFSGDELRDHRSEIEAKASGQCVKTFVANQWTLEYDLAHSALGREVWIAIKLAKADDRINDGRTTAKKVVEDAVRQWVDLQEDKPSREELASKVYAALQTDSHVSKTTTAQYLSCLLEGRQKNGRLTAEKVRETLPKYLVAAIEYATSARKDSTNSGA